ncbi:Speckle-type POZ protein [Araneus ventricosus]|uniref:Speckle-type POZ protein n=1 Tax=Araneus ventricosus TaxID=182803 RepID=A0A4Y2KL28_ARAVE|nr:Speckle-type POZ protein [Araneus ventricosus]
MSRKEDTERACFTFTWTLENVSYCWQKKGERIGSPVFAVNMAEKTKWRLWLYPRGYRSRSCVGIFLERNAGCGGEDVVEIDYELALLATDGSILRSSNSNGRSFRKDQVFGYDKFTPRGVVFLEERLLFLPRDVLTTRCKIWKTCGDVPESGECSARTCIGIERRFFAWNVGDFSTLEPETKRTYTIESVSNEEMLMCLDLYLGGGLNCEELIHFEVTCVDRKIKYSTVQLFLLDAVGNKLKCYQDEFWFDTYGATKPFTLLCTKNWITAKKNLYLSDDVLRLQGECTFSKGVVLEEITKVQHGSASARSSTILSLDDVNESSVSFQDFAENFKSLYRDGFLSDVKLVTKTETFPAHKFVLSAHSPVFKAMFSNDMKENASDRVVIEELSDDTIRSMLLYAYTSVVEDLDWENACELYAAADKYEMLALKKKCSTFLETNLSVANACDLLLLSSLHQDEDLTSVARDFILEHDKEIINSEDWEHLMETHTKLAADVMRLKFKN